jgi:excisionase family DNA binding protein
MQSTRYQKLLHVHHVAARLQIAERTVRRLACRGELPGFKVGRKLWRFRESDIEALLSDRIGGHMSPAAHSLHAGVRQ